MKVLIINAITGEREQAENLLQASKKVGLSYQTLQRRMKDGNDTLINHKYKVLELK